MNDEYEQSNIFEESIPLFKINKHISLIELFGGIGSQAKALERLQEKGFIPHGFSHYKLVEYDKYPVASYNAIHNTTFSPLDITKIHADDLGIRERERMLPYDLLLPLSRYLGKRKTKGASLRRKQKWAALRSRTIAE